MSDKVNVCNTPRPEEFDMAQAVQLTIFTLLGILGWHGVFLLFIVVTFKLFLQEHGNYDCPCDWSAVYGTIMFLCPSLLTYIIAFFAYFRQDDNSVPWKVFRKLYEVKFACHQFDERTVWESHAEYCVRCKLVKRDWSLAKVALSAVFSFLYPLVWLSMSFLQGYYYVCTVVGPSRTVLQLYCNATVDNPGDYDRAYGLAIIRSNSIGSIVFVCTLCFVGLFVVFYGEIANHLWKKYDWSPYRKVDNQLQVQVSVTPSCRSISPEISVSPYSNRDTPISSIPEEGATETQSLIHSPNEESKTIRINLSKAFAESLQGCLQNGAWQGVDIRCEESRSRRESYAAFRPPSRARLQQQRTGEHCYESLPPLA